MVDYHRFSRNGLVKLLSRRSTLQQPKSGYEIKLSGFLRMKVIIKVKEPLKISFNLKRMDKSTIDISFKYDKLPDFCCHCGRLGHVARDCCNRHDDIKKSIFGPWLRAKPY
ncbi:hypothetical protein REPUB_Repub02eG0205700 [Reevesia pubescens]